ncbi:MAG TPA: Uma2 family endonuclease [Spirochaetia bacterium]|nr:Uma2 family endonuclease [Spirochaetia bacterium]
MTNLREALTEYTASRPLPPGKLSFEEFLNWCDEDTWAEWVNGEVIILTPASFSHQIIFCFLDRVMGIFARHNQLGVVLTAPFMVRLPEHLRRGREPDIIFVRQEQLPRFKQTYFDGSPDVIVEIVSPESCIRDREIKYGEYEAAGVREYWLIDPDHRQADFFHLGADGRYHPETPDKEGVFHSAAFSGFRLKPDWLWQDPLPSEIAVLREMGVL